MPPRIMQEADGLRLDHPRDVGDFFGLLGGMPTLDLALGMAHPFRLTIEAAITNPKELTLEETTKWKQLDRIRLQRWSAFTIAPNGP